MSRPEAGTRSEERRVGKECRARRSRHHQKNERHLKDIIDEYNYAEKKGNKDEGSILLEASTMKSRRGFAIYYFFFSSRRRHTRWTGDWSSDVCSSDLRHRRRCRRRSTGRRSRARCRGPRPA